MPTAASISASTANTPTSSARNRGCDVDSAATSSIVRTRVSGWSLSTRAIAAFTAGRNDIGSPAVCTAIDAENHGFCAMGT